MSENSLKVVTGITVTPPVVGHISIGHVDLVPRDGASPATVPVKDDEFTITTLVQGADHVWERHALDASLRKPNAKLTEIPIVLAYNDPGLTLNNKFIALQDGRPVCVGNGQVARRMTSEGMHTISCPGLCGCAYGVQNNCATRMRFYARVEGQTDPLGLFMLRSTSRHTLSNLSGRLWSLYGMTNGQLAGMPLKLTIVKRTGAISLGDPFWISSIEFRDGMDLPKAFDEAKKFQKGLTDAGLSIDKLEETLRSCGVNSDFSDELEDLAQWVADETAETPEAAKSRAGMAGMNALVLATRQQAETTAADATEAKPAAPAAAATAEQPPAEQPAADAPATSVAKIATTIDLAAQRAPAARRPAPHIPTLPMPVGRSRSMTSGTSKPPRGVRHAPPGFPR